MNINMTNKIADNIIKALICRNNKIAFIQKIAHAADEDIST